MLVRVAIALRLLDRLGLAAIPRTSAILPAKSNRPAPITAAAATAPSTAVEDPRAGIERAQPLLQASSAP